MSVHKCSSCLTDIQSTGDFEIHINKCICKINDSKYIPDNSNSTVLKSNIAIINSNQNNESIESIPTESKNSKLKEIGNSVVDTISITSSIKNPKEPIIIETTKSNELDINEANNVITLRSIEKNHKNGNNNKENYVTIPNNSEKKCLGNIKSRISKNLNETSEKKTNIVSEIRTDEDERNAKKSNKLSFACPTCPEEFETAYQLTTHVILHRYESQNIESASQTTESESVTDNVSSSETVSLHKSPIKKRSTKRKKPDSEAEENTPKKFKMTLSCDLCSKIFHRKENLTAHKNKYHKGNSASCVKKPNSKMDNNIKCQHCSMEFESQNVFQIHQTAYCFKAASDLKEWALKNMPYHFGCVICGMSFKSSKRLEFHKEEHANFKWPVKKSST